MTAGPCLTMVWQRDSRHLPSAVVAPALAAVQHPPLVHLPPHHLSSLVAAALLLPRHRSARTRRRPRRNLASLRLQLGSAQQTLLVAPAPALPLAVAPALHSVVHRQPPRRRTLAAPALHSVVHRQPLRRRALAARAHNLVPRHPLQVALARVVAVAHNLVPPHPPQGALAAAAVAASAAVQQPQALLEAAQALALAAVPVLDSERELRPSRSHPLAVLPAAALGTASAAVPPAKGKGRDRSGRSQRAGEGKRSDSGAKILRGTLFPFDDIKGACRPSYYIFGQVKISPPPAPSFFAFLLALGYVSVLGRFVCKARPGYTTFVGKGRRVRCSKRLIHRPGTRTRRGVAWKGLQQLPCPSS